MDIKELFKNKMNLLTEMTQKEYIDYMTSLQSYNANLAKQKMYAQMDFVNNQHAWDNNGKALINSNDYYRHKSESDEIRDKVWEHEVKYKDAEKWKNEAEAYEKTMTPEQKAEASKIFADQNIEHAKSLENLHNDALKLGFDKNHIMFKEINKSINSHNSKAFDYYQVNKQNGGDAFTTSKEMKANKEAQNQEPQNTKQAEPSNQTSNEDAKNISQQSADNNLSNSIKDREEAIKLHNSHAKDIEGGFGTSDQYKAMEELRKKYPGIEDKNSDFYKNLNADKSKISQQAEAPKQEPSAFDHAKEQTKAPTEFKKAEPVEENPAKPEASNKVPEKEPSAFENSSAYKKQQAEQKAAETKAESPKQAEPAKAEAPKQAETKVETTKTAEPNHPNITKPADAQPAPKTQEVSNMPKDNSHLTGGTKQLDQSNPLNKSQLGTKPETVNKVEPVKTEAPKQQASNSEELAKNAKQAEPAKAEAPKPEAAPKTAEPNHPNITKPADAQPAQPVQPAPVNPHPSAPGTIAPAQQPVQPQVQNQPVDNSHLTGGVKQLDQSNPLNKPQIGNQQVAQQPVQPQPVQPAPVNPHPSAPGTVAPVQQPVQPVQPQSAPVPNHPNITKPADAQPVQPAPVNPHPSAPGTVAPTSAPQPAPVQNQPIDNSHLTGGVNQLNQSNPLNNANFGHNGGITTSQPSMIPSSGHFVNNTPQPVSNPVDHWANFKQSSHDAYGHLKNFAGQQYHNIKQNLGHHYQNIKQSASEHLHTAKQFATDHAHEIAGAGALGAAGLAAYAAYKHFKNKKKQPAPQPHH